MGSRRECTRILSLEAFRVEAISWEGDGAERPSADQYRATKHSRLRMFHLSPADVARA